MVVSSTVFSFATGSMGAGRLANTVCRESHACRMRVSFADDRTRPAFETRTRPSRVASASPSARPRAAFATPVIASAARSDSACSPTANAASRSIAQEIAAAASSRSQTSVPEQSSPSTNASSSSRSARVRIAFSARARIADHFIAVAASMASHAGDPGSSGAPPGAAPFGVARTVPASRSPAFTTAAGPRVSATTVVLMGSPWAARAASDLAMRLVTTPASNSAGPAPAADFAMRNRPTPFAALPTRSTRGKSASTSSVNSSSGPPLIRCSFSAVSLCLEGTYR